MILITFRSLLNWDFTVQINLVVVVVVDFSNIELMLYIVTFHTETVVSFPTR